MNFRNNKSSNRPGTLTVKGVPYSLVRSEIFYYLKFVDYDKSIFKNASSLTSKPTIVFYTENSISKAVIDYSLANETDKKYLNSFFANMTRLDTFSMISAEYLNKSELSANLNATYTFVDYKDDKIFAIVNSITTLNSAIDVYFGDYFIETPQISKSGDLGSFGTKKYALVNVNPLSNKNFNSLGLLQGDFLEIVNPDSVNNLIKFRVNDLKIINDTEVLELTPYNEKIPVEESMIGSTTLVNLYVKGTVSSTEETDDEIGCCSDLTGLFPIPNQTKKQCSARFKNSLFTSGPCTQSYLNTSSSTNPDVIVNTITNTTLQETRTYYVSILEYGVTTTRITPLLTRQATNTSSTKSIVLTDAQGNIISSGSLQIQRGNSYNFIQLDQSNKNKILRIAIDEYGTPFDGDAEIFTNLTKDSINSNLTLNVRDTTVSVLYLVSATEPGTLPIQLNLV
jgi:hypothetical protein